MSGNITGLEVVISGIIKRRIAIFLLCYFLCGYFFPARGGYSWVVLSIISFAVSLERGSHNNRAFLEFLLCIFVTKPLFCSLVFAHFCLFVYRTRFLCLLSSTSIPFNLLAGEHHL